MKPTALKPGDKVTVAGIGQPRQMTFLRRERGYLTRPAVNLFQCDDYRGLNGPNDDGKCEMSDSYVVRNVTRSTNGEPQR